LNYAAETRYAIETKHPAHKPNAKAAWKIGTSTIKQTPTTNCPADLQIATANLILLQQQSTTMRN